MIRSVSSTFSIDERAGPSSSFSISLTRVSNRNSMPFLRSSSVPKVDAGVEAAQEQ